MQRYILRRLLMLLLVLLGVSFLSYATMRIVPGDVVMQRLAESPSVSAKDVTALRHELGLDRPLLVQYGSWLAGVVRGDLGRSLWTDEPVRDQIAKRLPVSLELALLSGLVSLTVGLTSGIISAIRQDSWIDYVVRLFTTLGLAIPAFALATLALVVLGVYWQWSPGVWYQPFTRDPAANLQQMFLPALLLGLSLWAPACCRAAEPCCSLPEGGGARRLVNISPSVRLDMIRGHARPAKVNVAPTGACHRDGAGPAVADVTPVCPAEPAISAPTLHLPLKSSGHPVE